MFEGRSMNMERVIITGGTGFIGAPLARQLAAKYEVVVLSRNPARVSSLGNGVKVVAWDGRTAEGWGQLADGAFAIINLAGENLSAGRWTPARKAAIVDSRQQAAEAVIAAISQAAVKPTVLVQASAVGYYGPRGDEKINENEKPGSTFDATTCVAWEKATDAVEAMGVRRVIIRTGVVIEKNGGALARMSLPFKLFVGGPVGSGKQYFPWIHLTDEINAIQFLMENKQQKGVFNLSAPNPVTMKEFAVALGKAMGRPAFMPVPGFALQILFGEMASILLNGQRVIPNRLLQQGFKFKYSTVDAALSEIYRA